MSNNEQWKYAQTRERNYYEGRAGEHREQGASYADFHAPLWQGILARVDDRVQFVAEGYYVDVGCGPNTILAFVDVGTRVGIDPLMPYYRENFSLPAGIDFHEGRIEDLHVVPDGAADAVFSMNNIDHIEDIARAALALKTKLKPEGVLIVSVNIVFNPLLRAVSRFWDVYRWLDPTHTYHFHCPEDVERALGGEFSLAHKECIEDLAESMAAKKKDNSDHPDGLLKAIVKRTLKYVKNDLLLSERHFLLVFEPTRDA